MNILIVGGAGYIGGALTDVLMDSDHDILVYDLHPEQIFMQL